jgi:hypothetical protein
LGAGRSRPDFYSTGALVVTTDGGIQQAIRALEVEEGDLAQQIAETPIGQRLARVRSILSDLRALMGAAQPDVPRPVAHPGTRPSAGGQMTIAQATREVLMEAGAPLHSTEIVERLRARGVRLPDDKERARRNLVGSINRRLDMIRPVGGGRYAAETGNVSPVPRKSEPSGNGVTHLVQATASRPTGPRVPTSHLVLDLVRREPGISAASAAERLAPIVATTSKAADSKKLIHSTVSYLIDKRRELRRDRDGGLFYIRTNPPITGERSLFEATANGNGPTENLRSDR